VLLEESMLVGGWLKKGRQMSGFEKYKGQDGWSRNLHHSADYLQSN
jgi:hypothetical protein